MPFKHENRDGFKGAAQFVQKAWFGFKCRLSEFQLLLYENEIDSQQTFRSRLVFTQFSCCVNMLLTSLSYKSYPSQLRTPPIFYLVSVKVKNNRPIPRKSLSVICRPTDVGQIVSNTRGSYRPTARDLFVMSVSCRWTVGYRVALTIRHFFSYRSKLRRSSMIGLKETKKL